MTLDELIKLVESTDRLPDFYGLKKEILNKLKEKTLKEKEKLNKI